MVRLEVIEKYPLKSKPDSYWEDLGMDAPPSEYGYRRTMPLIDQIERPIEIPHNKKECIIRFWGGDDIVILSNYDDFCLKLHDIEEQMLIEQQLIQYEIDNAANK